MMTEYETECAPDEEPIRKTRVRSLQAAIDEIKENDPGTILTYARLLRLIHDKTLPCITLGRRYYVDMDVLYECLKGSYIPTEAPAIAGIRLIKE